MSYKIPGSSSAKVEFLRHKDRRANIPTEELRDFVADDELAPKIMPRKALQAAIKSSISRRGRTGIRPFAGWLERSSMMIWT